MRSYTTIQGDTWDIIAFKMYGDENLMHVLIDANYIYNSLVIFSANIELNIPDVATKTKVSFPAWRAN
jgi:phage tail protein X